MTGIAPISDPPPYATPPMLRSKPLDGLRGVAVFLIIIFHASDLAVTGAWIGVDVFFVLSGFLITTILMTELDTDGGISFKRFYLRRTLRLAPALVVLIVADVLIGIAENGRSGDHALGALAAALYVMNWVRAFGLPYES